MRLVYGNCFGLQPEDVLATDERLVAEAAPPHARIVMADEAIDPDEGQAANIALWQLAFDWFRMPGGDVTEVAGISAGELAAVEVAVSVLQPAARGVLAVSGLIERLAPTRVRTGVPAGGAAPYLRAELAQCDAAEAAVAQLLGPDALGERLRSHDQRNAVLERKYALVRDPWLPSPGRRRDAQLQSVEHLTRLLGRRCRRDTLLVQEYNPTQAFATGYSAHTRRLRMVRVGADRHALWSALRHGDTLAVLPYQAPTSRAPAERARLEHMLGPHRTVLQDRFAVHGVSLWDGLGAHVLDVIERYQAFAAGAAPVIDRLLDRERVRAVLVPFDTPPLARLLVRMAQRRGLPTFVINNGILADEFQQECMTADIGLAWSESLARHVFSRRPAGRTVVTGNPKADVPRRPVAPRTATCQRLLLSSFTFSPVDLNCRRSDSERYLEDVLSGARRAAPEATLTLKLHPADTVAHYAATLEARPEVRVVAEGDVTLLFAEADAYVATYSTSLLEAAARGLPVVYYAVNSQRFLPPFAGDPFLERWTARSPEQIATLVREALDAPPEAEDLKRWAATYLGPLDGGSVGRIAAVVEDELATRRGRPR